MEQAPKEMMNQLNAVIEAELKPTQLEKVIDNAIYNLNTSAITNWYYNESGISANPDQLKLIKHIWLNDPQFEEEKPKKYVVQFKEPNEYGQRWVVTIETIYGIKADCYMTDFENATKFDTREEAERWTNPLTEVVEVEE